MDISVIVCTYNRAHRLRRTLESFAQLELRAELPWELLVVDNNSSDDTGQVVQDFAKSCGLSVRYLFEPQQGKSFALNAGVREARGEIIAFSDDDVTPEPEWLVNVKHIFDIFDCIGVAGKIVPVWNHPKPCWLEMENQQAVGHFDFGENAKEIHVPPLGANMAFRRAAFEKYGLFRVDLGPCGEESAGCEDDEFGSRLMRAGEKIIYAPKAVVYHDVDPGKTTRSYFLRWFFSMGKVTIRSRLWPQNAVLYFGIPRYLLRSLLENSIKWALTLNDRRRFQYKLQVYRAAGGILEARQLYCQRSQPSLRG